jgi:phosphatidylglycerophosphatase A
MLRPMPRFHRVGMLVATAGGLGLLRPAPGTWGTAGAAVVAAMVVAWCGWSPLAFIVAALAATIAAAWAVPVAQRRFGLADPPAVVIDEVAGTWLALALVPATCGNQHPWLAILLAAALFRLFDIAKPSPVAELETLPGWVGVMVDDLAAGLCAGLATGAILG